MTSSNRIKTEIVRGTERYAGAPARDLGLGISLESEKRELIEGDRTVVLNLTERFNRAFDKTIFGIIENQAEEDARSTAAGHLTEAFLQMYNAAKVGTKVLGPGIQYASRKARELAPKLVKAVRQIDMVS